MRVMKDSGIAWIGEIPENWKMVQVRYLFRIGRGRVISQTELQDNGIYPVFSSQTKDNGCLGYINTYDFDISQLTWTTDGANAGTVFLRSGKHNCTNVCGTLQPLNAEIDLRFQKYALEHIAYYHKRADTNGFKIMNNEMANIYTILPPLNTQRRIADYLDRKCSQIDAIIDRQQEVIEKLKAYKLSVITEAVTKGLNPHAPMKDSGVEWIGEIPEQWEIRRIGSFAKVTSSKRIFEESYVDEGVPFYRSKEITDLSKGLNVQTEIFIPEEIFAQVSKVSPAPKSGDILLTSIGTIGNTWISDGRKFYYKDGNITQIEANDSFDSAYLEYCFSSNVVLEQYTRLAMGSILLALTIVKIKKILVVFPPLNEQRKIVRFLRIKCGSIENIVKHKQSLINKLAAYKKSLIYEVVTGKKEVK